MHTLEAQIPVTDTRVKPLQLSSLQLRSLSRHLSNAGRHCQIQTLVREGHRYPIFLGVSGAEVIAAAHAIPSLRALGWLKVVLAEVTLAGQEGPAFCSALLEWERKGESC